MLYLVILCLRSRHVGFRALGFWGFGFRVLESRV